MPIVRIRGFYLQTRKKFIIDLDFPTPQQAADYIRDQTSLAGNPIAITDKSVVTTSPHGLNKFYEPRRYESRKNA